MGVQRVRGRLATRKVGRKLWRIDRGWWPAGGLLIVAARPLGPRLVEKPLRSEEEARAAITRIRKRDAGGIFSLRLPSSNIPGFTLGIAPLGMLPTMFHVPVFVERCGCVSYSASTYVRADRVIH